MDDYNPQTKFLGRYYHRGHWFTFDFYATDFEDAEAICRAHNLKLDGEWVGLCLINAETPSFASKIRLTDKVLRETFWLIVDSVRRSLDPLFLPRVAIASCLFCEASERCRIDAGLCSCCVTGGIAISPKHWLPEASWVLQY